MPRRIGWDSSCFIAWVDRAPSEDSTVLQALDETMSEMVRGRIRVVASRAIETEVRPGDLAKTQRFHHQLRACPYFESFGEGPTVRRLARELQDRLQQSGRRGGYADLIHVATAIAAQADEIWTTDKRVVRWHTEDLIPEVSICRPHLVQGVLDLG